MTLTRIDDRSNFRPVTKELLEELFSGARVTGGAGHFRIKTARSKVTVTPSKIKVAYPSEDVYRGVVLLVACWPGGARVRGSREAILACIAYGEAWGVLNIHADHKSRIAGLGRVFAAGTVVYVGFGIWPKSGNDPTGLGIVGAALLVLALLRWLAKKTEHRKAETGGFLYPRETQGNAKFASDEQLRKAGLI